MDYKTWTTLKAEIVDELDLEDEDFITATELMRKTNDLIKHAEAVIHNLHEDYFRRSDNIEITSGTASYAMPTDIYANKMRRVIFNDGTNKYRVKRIPLDDIVNVETGDDYQYDIINTSATTGVQMVLYPTPDFNDKSGSLRSPRRFTRWYLRCANQIATGASKVDLPEFYTFLKAGLKLYALLKQEGTVPQMALQAAAADFAAEEQRMKDSLASMVVDDEEGKIEPDTTFYEEFG